MAKFLEQIKCVTYRKIERRRCSDSVVMSIDASATLHWPNGVSIHRRYWRCQPGGQWGRQGRHPPHWFLSGVPWSRVGPPSSLPSPPRPLGRVLASLIQCSDRFDLATATGWAEQRQVILPRRHKPIMGRISSGECHIQWSTHDDDKHWTTSQSPLSTLSSEFR